MGTRRESERSGVTPGLRTGAGRPRDERAASHAVLVRIEGAGGTGKSTARLVENAQAGDDLAFAEIYVTFFDRVYRYLLIALKNADDAQEVSQDVFARALSTLDRYQPQRGEFRDWLFSMVRSAALDHLRQGARAHASDPRHMPTGAATLADRATSLLDRLDPEAGVRSMIESLPDAQRRALTLRFVFDMTPLEIAEALGSTPDAVRHMQHRAIKALASSMAERND